MAKQGTLSSTRGPDGWDATVLLPRGLTITHLRRARAYLQKELTDLVEIYQEQANVFSGLVGIYGARALDAFSPYEKHRHKDLAQQRFPDLRHKTAGPKPPPALSLESKGSKRPWELQSHYDHPGWYIVWRYLVDETESIEPGQRVVVWRIDVAFLQKQNWKYEGSKAGEAGGGRTHTFGIRNAAQAFRDKSVFVHPRIELRSGKPTPKED